MFRVSSRAHDTYVASIISVLVDDTRFLDPSITRSVLKTTRVLLGDTVDIAARAVARRVTLSVRPKHLDASV